MAFIAAPFDPFQALGLERDATPETIQDRYHQLARRYHPNRHQGTDESKAALSEYFHHVARAWDLLKEPAKRRRYIELLDLYDLHETIQAGAADLFNPSEVVEQVADSQKQATDGPASSEADDDDEDLPRIAGITKRETFDRALTRTPTLGGASKDSDSDRGLAKESKPKGSRLARLRSRVDSGRDSDASEQSIAAERRRRYDKLRKKEVEAFNVYRDAMIAKFDAEENAERCKELFDKAAWRRQYFERAPKETSQRMRLIRLFNIATKAFTAQQEPVRRRKGSSVSAGGQILSTGDPFQSNQFLSLPTRTKSIRRQGFSSDISVDQTSSDEDYSSDKASSPNRNARASSPAPNHRRQRSGDQVPHAVNTAPRRLPNANQDPISPITGPAPRVIVRTATNLHEIAEEAGSDIEMHSAASSRPSSPEARASDQRGFKLLPHMRTAELFGNASDQGGQPPNSEHHHHHHVNGHHGHHISHGDTFWFEIKQVRQMRHSHIPIDHVHDLQPREKQLMLSVEADNKINARQLLNALSELDQSVASKFMVKPDIKKDFHFRLIYSHREVVKQQHTSFIALSYRRKIHVDQNHKGYSLPLEPEMFHAVWDERLSDNEGVWIDQICIKQDSEDEKTISMSAMDMVYRSARLVVVALDDIDLESHEGRILESHIKDFESPGQQHIPANKRFRRKPKPYLESRDELYVVIRKILRSSWFRRAWCRHEMRLARNHIFLVPCCSSGSRPGRSVLRFSGACLTHLLGLATEVAFEPAIEAVKPALYAFFRDRSKLSPEHQLRSHHGNFSTVVAEVLAMEAGGDPNIPEAQRESDARKDKISIILNTMECGLALQPKVRRSRVTLPVSECNYMLLLLALAARDPGALCSVGHSFRELPYNLSSTWMLQPTNVDSGLNNYRTLNRLPEIYPITTHYENNEHFVKLDFKFLTQTQVVKPKELSENLALAQHFMDVCEKRKFGRNRKRYLLNDRTANQLFGSMWDVYVDTFACLLECGPDWFSEICQRYGVSRWKYDLQPAYDLLIAFKNTMGHWPDSAWSQQAAGFIMDFVNFLVIRGMPQRQIMQPQNWRPISVHPPNGGSVLTFIPPGNIRVAMPAALMDSDYLHLARMWILEPRGEYEEDSLAHYHEWTLLGKSVLFTDEIAMEQLETDNGRIRGGQKVFGRIASLSTG